ncbi:MAG: hypothetical protein PHW79_01560 [Candidatus Marinimicrobia bacterium]|nr:hypothetical protein [Candidatus Neomarinimicrobiota bacterium]
MKTFVFIVAHVAARMTAIPVYICIVTRIGYIIAISMKIVLECNKRFPDEKWNVFQSYKCWMTNGLATIFAAIKKIKVESIEAAKSPV